MTVTAAKILTAETVPKYLEERWEELSKSVVGSDGVPLSLENVKVNAIQGGNVNYAFCITLKDGQTIFLKQVGESDDGGVNWTVFLMLSTTRLILHSCAP